jgi:hypothetical protein
MNISLIYFNATSTKLKDSKISSEIQNSILQPLNNAFFALLLIKDEKKGRYIQGNKTNRKE